MKFVYPEINTVFDTQADTVNTLIIENQRLFTDLLNDINSLLNGSGGKSVLSDKGKELDLSKNAELLTQFVPFELNKKSLLSKAMTAMEKEAVREDNYLKSSELLSSVEAFLYHVSKDMKCDVGFSSVTVPALIKSAGLSFNENYDNLAEKIIDYFELVTEFDRKKLFITVDLRSYISDKESELFLDTVLRHNYNVLMIENCERNRLTKEKRYIVDDSLCEIG